MTKDRFRVLKKMLDSAQDPNPTVSDWVHQRKTGEDDCQCARCKLLRTMIEREDRQK